MAEGIAIGPRIGPATANEVAGFFTCVVADGPGTVTDANGRQTGPRRRGADARDALQHGITTKLPSAMSLFLSLITVVGHPREVLFTGIQERLPHVRQQVRLVVLDR